jgi:hypothetical protein
LVVHTQKNNCGPLLLAKPSKKLIPSDASRSKVVHEDSDGYFIVHRDNDGTGNARLHEREMGAFLPVAGVPA